MYSLGMKEVVMSMNVDHSQTSIEVDMSMNVDHSQTSIETVMESFFGSRAVPKTHHPESRKEPEEKDQQRPEERSGPIEE